MVERRIVLTFAGVVVDGNSAGGDIVLLRRVGNVAESDAAGQAISNFQRARHGCNWERSG
jgi:hypothetical protein